MPKIKKQGPTGSDGAIGEPGLQGYVGPPGRPCRVDAVGRIVCGDTGAEKNNDRPSRLDADPTSSEEVRVLCVIGSVCLSVCVCVCVCACVCVCVCACLCMTAVAIRC